MRVQHVSVMSCVSASLRLAGAERFAVFFGMLGATDGARRLPEEHGQPTPWPCARDRALPPGGARACPAQLGSHDVPDVQSSGLSTIRSCCHQSSGRRCRRWPAEWSFWPRRGPFGHAGSGAAAVPPACAGRMAPRRISASAQEICRHPAFARSMTPISTPADLTAEAGDIVHVVLRQAQLHEQGVRERVPFGDALPAYVEFHLPSAPELQARQALLS